jgi:branched-chain amino acid transport system ATP-binding protein
MTSTHAPTPAPTGAPIHSPILEIRDLCKSFGGLQVTRSVNLQIAQGERHLLIGPNGAGKTTLFNLITGDLPSNSGHIALMGHAVTRMSTANRAQLGLARTYQIVTLFGRDTLLHNVKLALLGKSAQRWRHWGVFGRDQTLTRRALAVLDSVGLAAKAELPLEQTSYGEKRRLEIAMALAQDPRVLLLDEPLAGLSAEERETITALLGRIDKNITILMIEHDMEVALAFADRITLLHYGEVILAGTRQEVVNDPRTREIYLGS